jgi:hypothetical protein
MPNIIEQQDLLKGLPDNRLAMMMQNPTGDIPPFLVAAEAQRRQAIREQFSGGPQESVVDTLTKQLANVPQNVQAQPQTPPQMPPPMMQPEMAGVAALQQQMPQQAMRRGGYVQRYQAAGLVNPLQTRVQDIATQFGVTVDQAAEMLRNNPSLGGGSSQPGLPFRVTEENRETFANPVELNLPAITISPDELSDIQREERREAKYQEMDSAPGYGESVYANRSAIKTSPNSSMGMSFVGGVPTANPSTPSNPEAGKESTSGENKLKGMTAAEVEKAFRDIYGTSSEDTEYMRQKLKELYSYEPSSWEKAQKWFSAAQAAIQPGQNNWQATINALAALGGGMAEERSGQRASERELAEAMLKLEMADRAERRQAEQNIAKGMFDYRMSEREAAAAAAADERNYLRDIEKMRMQDELTGKRELARQKILDPTAAIRSFEPEIEYLQKQLEYLQKQLESGLLDQEAQDRIRTRIDALLREQAAIRKSAGYGASSVPTIEEMRRIAAGQ